MIDQRKDDGRVWMCTLCYDRIGEGQEPACAKACPTDSIQFGELSELRERADRRVEQLHNAGVDVAQLYGRDPDDGVGGDGAFFLGGLAGASSILAAGSELTGRPHLGRAAKIGAVTAIGGSVGALIHDLGRPERFVNMLRVFKPTSPMSMGSWLLTLYGPLTGVAAGAALLSGSVCTRLGIFAAGVASAEDPAYTVKPQRARADTSAGR